MLLYRSFALLAALLPFTQGLTAPRSDIGSRSVYSPSLSARDTTGASALDFSRGNYYINITLGGQPYFVIVDTGSWDLLVTGPVHNATDTGVNTSIVFAIGADQGPVKKAELNILGYTIPEQAFMEVASDDPDQAGRGLIGLGPNSASLVYAALGNQSSADSPFDRIFREYPSTPQFFTFQLGRHILTVGDQKNTGELTLGSVLPQYQNVTNQPKVEIFLLPDGFAFYQHWLISLDPNGIIGPNGPIKLKSNITHNETLVSLVDTGFTLAQLPHDAASEIYSGLKGAKLENITALGGEVWTFDCDQTPNVTISLGGQLYPVHPLDSSRVFIEDNNKTICFGAFQPKIPGANDPTYDMILGEAFLTNAYVLVHYGNLVDSGNSSSTTNGSSSTSTSNSNSNSTDLPYMQFLSLTDAKTAHAEFVEARKKLAPGVKGFYERHKVPILVGSSIAGGVIVLSIIVSLVMRRSRQRAYRHLSAPAPTGDTQMQMPMQMQMQEQHAGTAGFNNTGARYAHHPSSSLSSASPRGS